MNASLFLITLTLLSVSPLLPEEDRVGLRPVNLYVARGAVLEPRSRQVMEAGSAGRAELKYVAVALYAELIDLAALQELRVARAVRRVAGRAAFGLYGRVLEDERPLLVRVALQARSVRARGQPRLLRLEPAVRVVAVGAFHRAFQHLVMERHCELRLGLVVALHAQLLLCVLEHLQRGRFGFERRRLRSEGQRICLRLRHLTVRAVTIHAADVVAPVLAAQVVVMLFPTRVARQTGFRDLLRALVFKSPNLRLIASALDVRLARPVAGFAPLLGGRPVGFVQLAVRGLREVVELLLVASLTGFAPDVVFWFCFIIGCSGWKRP